MGVSCPCLTEMSPGFLLGWDVLSAPPGAASLVLICLLSLQLHELFPLTLVSCSFPEVCLAVWIYHRKSCICGLMSFIGSGKSSATF